MPRAKSTSDDISNSGNGGSEYSVGRAIIRHYANCIIGHPCQIGKKYCITSLPDTLGMRNTLTCGNPAGYETPGRRVRGYIDGGNLESTVLWKK